MCIIIFYTDADKMIEKITTLAPPTHAIFPLVIWFCTSISSNIIFDVSLDGITVISKCISLDYEVKES